MTYEELQKEIFKRADQAEKQDKQIGVWEDRSVYLNIAVLTILNDWKNNNA